MPKKDADWLIYVRLNSQSPRQLRTCISHMISYITYVIWLPWQVAGKWLTAWVEEAEFPPLSDLDEDKFGLQHLHYLWVLKIN